MLRAFVHLLVMVDHPGSWGALAGGVMFLWTLFVVVAVVFTIYCTWRVAEKSGYPGVYSLLLLVPVVNIIVQLYWVFAEWPIETELRRLRITNR